MLRWDMPENISTERPEWNEENVTKVIADLYREAETDEDLHKRLMTHPFEVLSSRIDVPEGFRGGIFAREKGKKTMALYVPPFGTHNEVLPEGTAEAESQSNYEILCTVHPPW